MLTLCLDSSSVYNPVETYPWWYIHQQLIPFYCWVVFPCLDMPPYTYPLTYNCHWVVCSLLWIKLSVLIKKKRRRGLSSKMHIYAIAYVLSVHQSVLRMFVYIMSLMRSSHSTKIQHKQCPTANRDRLFQFSKGGKSHKGTGVGSGPIWTSVYYWSR